MPPGGWERRLLTLEGQVTLLRNEVPQACFQPAKVSRLRQQIVEADEQHPWGEAQNLYLPSILNKHTESIEKCIFHFQRIDICLPLREYPC